MKKFFTLFFLFAFLKMQAAIFYVRSTDGNNTDSGATWALAKETITGAFAACAAGDTIYVSQSHAESTNAAVTLTSPGTAVAPCYLICANDGAEPPTATATTASVNLTGGTALSFAGFAYAYGIIFNGSTANSASSDINFVSASPWYWKIESSSLRVIGPNSGACLTIGASGNVNEDGQLLELINTTMLLSNASSGIIIRCPVKWRNTASAFLPATGSTNIFLANAAASSGYLRCIGVDYSALGSGRSIVDISGDSFNDYKFVDCKLGSSIAFTSGVSAGQGGTEAEFINCDSSDTHHVYYYSGFNGIITNETTIIRSGGASDGTQGFSRRMVSSANCSWASRLESPPIEFYNTSLGAITVSIPFITDNVSFTNNQVGIRCEFLGTSGTPFGNFTNSMTATILTTPTVYPTDSTSTWTTTGLTTPLKQTLSCTFTPAEVGIVRVYVTLAKASTTLYYDPKAVVGNRQYQSEAGVVNEPSRGTSYSFGQ